MEKKFTNKEIANLLKNVSAAYQVKGKNQFQIRAYDLAADSIEHATSEVKDLWESGQIDQIPNVGSHIANFRAVFGPTPGTLRRSNIDSGRSSKTCSK